MTMPSNVGLRSDSLQRQPAIHVSPAATIRARSPTAASPCWPWCAMSPATIRVDRPYRSRWREPPPNCPRSGIIRTTVNPGGVLAPAPNGGAILFATARWQRHALRRQRRYLHDIAQRLHLPPGAVCRLELRLLRRRQLHAQLFAGARRHAGKLASGAPSGFAFVDQGGLPHYLVLASTSPGIIERFDASQAPPDHQAHATWSKRPAPLAAASDPLLPRSPPAPVRAPTSP